jgi:glycerol-3-phosphate dehydrogenase (NAD(P)+)
LSSRVSDVHHIGVVGGGAWGTALACLARRATRRVTLWSRDPAVSASIVHKRSNPVYLPGQVLEPGIEIAFALASLEACDAILLACPAQAVRTVAAGLPGASPVVICAKGIETATGLLMPEVLAEVMPNRPFAMLLGPSFAEEAVQGLPTAVSIATSDPSLGRDLAAALAAGTFRPYWTDDVTGVSLGGAVKNVLAIAAGIVAGRGLGASAAAALTTRGFAELLRFGQAYGARAETLTGLSGLGDLILTCSTPQSRNYSFGVALGRGDAAQTANGKLAEGAFTAQALIEMARARGVDMPVASAVADVLDGGVSVDAAIGQLLARPFREE